MLTARQATSSGDVPSGLGTVTPEDRRRALVIAGGSILLLLPGLFWGVTGGKAIVGALRILNGEIPYRDFWTMYAPGQFYLVAALFRLFGVHVFVAGLAYIVLVAAAAAVFFLILRRLRLPVLPALIVTTVFTAMQWTPRPEVSSYEPALLLVLLAVGFVLRYFHGEGGPRLLIAGALCGVTAWFKHDVAFHVAVGFAAAIAISWLLCRSRPEGWLHPLKGVGLVAVGSIATALPAITLVAVFAGPDAWRDLIVFPATDFRVVRGEGYPPLLMPWAPIAGWLRDWTNVGALSGLLDVFSGWIIGNVPQVVFVGAVAWLWRSRGRVPSDLFAAVTLFVCCMPLFWLAAHVQQNTHLYSLALMSFFLGAIAWQRVPPGGHTIRRVLVAVFVVHSIGLLLPSALKAAEIVYFWPGRAMEFPSVRGVRLPAVRYEVYQPIVSFVRRHVPEDEAIYVGVTRHDAVVISNQTFYYLAERPVASRYNELHPGVTDRADVQQEIMVEIGRLGVRCVVLWKFGWPDSLLDSILAQRRAELPELGSRVLDEFIAREFEVLAQFDEYQLLWRRSAPKPEGWQDELAQRTFASESAGPAK
jgi:hypothetical protein